MQVKIHVQTHDRQYCPEGVARRYAAAHDAPPSPRHPQALPSMCKRLLEVGGEVSIFHRMAFLSFSNASNGLRLGSRTVDTLVSSAWLAGGGSRSHPHIQSRGACCIAIANRKGALGGKRKGHIVVLSKHTFKHSAFSTL